MTLGGEALNREHVLSLAPELDATCVDEVMEYLTPLWERLAEIDPLGLADVEPAWEFDAVAAAGPLPAPHPLPGAPAVAHPTPPATAAELAWLGPCDLAELVRRREISAVQIVEAYLARIAALQPRLNAFITVTAAEARTAAAHPAPGPLSGVPLAVKDIVATAGVRTTAGSRLLADHVPRADAACWQRLRAAGAVLLGKANTHEFAAGATNENPHYGPAHNPWALERVSGGSSGGSAVAVAAALAAAAVGTDTAGSVRIPAACCGVVGIKPTYGRVVRSGVVPLSWSLDHVGPLARSVRDAARVLDVLAGGGGCEPAARAGAASGLNGWRIGVPRRGLLERLHADVATAFAAALHSLSGLGAELIDVELPDVERLTPINRVIILAEATAWHSGYLRQRAGEYGANVRGRFEAGRFLSAVDYLLAQRLRAVACRRTAEIWQRVDLLALPTLSLVAPPIGSLGASASLLHLTAPFNVLGCPAVSVPCGFGEAGMPAGLQIVAAPGWDAQACYAAAAYEAANEWSRRRPPVAQSL